ncbi:hypothetical protein FGG90_07555 [Clavibacter tessellarius]|uniref:Uncharacterized protein n=1 Tax=Clavibacter tessellarius TaxID=31965 RepID=A0A225C8Y9_9MICO|nr:hypothetical protein [Clavibacter michiganensis]OQJ63148.1 hypothetical protein B5P24_09165 [Clavibacter michiganensis subsp. tessellarius]UKF33871.1 hypothetical protein FGG90_07555 [Clavibacter michiganensis subsp. tessellarius]
MSRSISALRAMTDEQLIKEHDEHTTHTVVGTGYYVEELDRRSRERATEASQRLADEGVKLSRRTHALTLVSAGMSALALVAAVLALFLS